MQIEKFGPNAVVFSSDSATVYINLSSNELDLSKVEEGALVLGKSGLSDKIYTITEPGEYEVANVSVVALENRDVKDGSADFYELEIDGIVVTWQADPTVEIDKEGWEMLTDTHLLLIDADSIPTDAKLDKFIAKHNPRKLLVVGDKQQAEKLTGIPVKDSNKKFKFTSKDFNEIEFTTESVHLA